MSRTTSTTSTTANDVTTPAGFLAEYDRRISALIHDNGWCSDAYAYSYPGDNLVRPHDRHPALSIPAEWLSDEGKAEVAKLNSATVDDLKKAVLGVAQSVTARGYVNMSQANEFFAALGIPEATSTPQHNGCVYVNATFTSGARFDGTARREAMAKVKEAVTSTLAGIDGLAPQPDGVGVDLTSDRYSNDQIQWPTL